MKIKTQKILKFIPIANFIILFIWIGAYYKHVTKPSRFIKNLLKMFLAVILITIPRIAAYKIGAPEFVLQLLLYICTYLSMLIMAMIAIKDQEKLIAEERI